MVGRRDKVKVSVQQGVRQQEGRTERMGPRFLGTLVTDLDSRIDAATDVAALSTLEISSVAYRSTDVLPNGLFVCIPGERADGHDFALEAAERGAAALVVEHSVPVDLPQIHFDNTRLALAQIARNFYDDPSNELTITAVTGTNGKTTTTYLVDWICRYHLDRALGLEGETAGEATTTAVAIAAAPATVSTGLIGTVETRIGTTRLPSKFTTPESLDLQKLLADMRDQGVSHVSMETSSHAIALHRVSGVNFAVAVFTNLTQDHLDFHKTMEEYFEAKAALFDSPLVAKRVIDIDTEAGRRLVARCRQNGFEPITCGCADDAQIRAIQVRYSDESTTFDLITPKGNQMVTYSLIGGFNVSNVLCACAAVLALGIPLGDIAGALASTPQIPGRLERVLAKSLAPQDSKQPPVRVFVDYSHTPDSICKALEALNEIKTAGTIIVFGCGGDRDRTKRPLMGKAALEADYAIVTSDNPRTEDPQRIIEDILPGMAAGIDRYEVEPDRRTAIAKALCRANEGDLVLIAGKGHEDYQLVGDKVLDFDDRVVAAEELSSLAHSGHWAAPVAVPGQSDQPIPQGENPHANPDIGGA